VTRSLALKVAAVTLTVVSALAGTGLARWLRAPRVQTQTAPPAAKLPAYLFRDWPKPDLVLLLSAQQHGYLLPCGCSHPQTGGLERRYNLLQLMKAKGWPIVALDLGDIPQKEGPAKLPNVQGLIKYRYAMMALKAMGYAATSFGEHEASLPLLTALTAYALNEERPRVLAANVLQREENFPGMLAPFVVEDKDVRGDNLPFKVGVVGTIGPVVKERIKDPSVHFTTKTGDALDKVLQELDTAKADLRVLLYQGLTNSSKKGEPPTEAVACAEAYPQFPVILCLSESDMPASEPRVVTNSKQPAKKTVIVTLGHKGRYVGVLGVYRTGKPDQPLQFRYQLVELTEDFLTPKDKEVGHPIIDLMEAYTRELKKGDYLHTYSQSKHPLQVMAPVANLTRPGEPTYVGSEKCKNCHEYAYEVWKKSQHNHAYQTLADARRPSLRQYDGECIVCHVTGFGYQGGFTDADKTPRLKNVGCESCHGPASVHVSNPTNKEWQARMNPWKAPDNETETAKTKRISRIDQLCVTCHDMDNDVTYIHGAFARKWPKIQHNTPLPGGQ
jgi:hypothetical protein